MPEKLSAGGLLLALMGNPSFMASVLAQDAAPASPPVLPRVTVTGTHIPRVQSEEASPVQVLTADDLANSGYTTVWQALSSITANGQGALSQNFLSAAAIGAAGVSLRGLGVGATLVLIDGHRSAAYPIGDDYQRAFVDLTTIPMDTVERIEILKDGASAIYGSDAIAGVVNIITKKSFTGFRLTADQGTSYRWDGSTSRLAGTAGFGELERDGHNFYISGEARKQNQIRFSDRGGMFEKTDFTSTGGYDTTYGVPSALNGNLPDSRTGYVTDANGRIVGFMPGCNATKLAAGKCGYSNSWSLIQPPTESYNLSARFTQQLAADWQVSLQGSYAIGLARQTHRPSTALTEGFQGITSGPGKVPTLLPALPPTSIPSTNPSFPAGTGLSSGLLHYTFLDDLGPKIDDSESRSSRVIAELKGDFAGWSLSGALGATRVSLDIRGQGNVNPANLQAALDSTTAPFLVGGQNSPAVLAAVAPVLKTTDTSRLNFAHLDGTRDLMRLPGGPLSIALGTDLVHSAKREVSPADAAAGLNQYGNGFAIGKQTVSSVYGEVVAPAAKNFTAEAAVRYDHYNKSGGKASPKLGFKYLPIPQVALRATVGRGFRAPGPEENGNAGTTFSTGATRDPQLCADAANPSAVGNFPSQCAIGAGTILGSNPNLKPETSTSYTFGVILEPVKDVSLSVDFYSIDIKGQIVYGSTTNVVRGTNLTPIGQVQSDGSLALVTPPVAPISYYQVGFVNANRTKTNGIDVDLQLRHHFQGIAELKSDFMLSFVNKYDLTVDGVTYKLAGTHGPIVVSGDTGNPRTRIRWVNTLSREGWSLTGTVNYIGSFKLTDPSIGVSDCVAGLGFGAGAAAYSNQLGNGVVPEALRCKVPSFTTFDLVGRYEFGKHLSMQFSILNLFNTRAPADWGTYAGSGKPFNPTLHTQGAIGRFFSLRAVYTF